MKAQMKKGLVDIYMGLMPLEIDEEIYLHLESIDGKIVDLVFTHGDAFEKHDNNIWLPNELWDEIT